MVRDDCLHVFACFTWYWLQLRLCWDEGVQHAVQSTLLPNQSTPKLAGLVGGKTVGAREESTTHSLATRHILQASVSK